MADNLTSKNYKAFFLCGQKGCGKTFFGRKLSEMSDITWIDLDDEILKSNPQFQSCRHLFKQTGETNFRKQELLAFKKVLSSFESGKTYIVSLGGGSCESEGLMELAKQNGRIIYLMQDEDTVYERTISNGIPPYLEGDSKSLFHSKFESRHNLYSYFSDFVVKLFDYTESQVVEKLKEIVWS